MTSDSRRTLERIALRVPVPEPAYDRMLRRRDRKDRNRRTTAAVVVVALALLSIAGLVHAFGNTTRPASTPAPHPTGSNLGIFSGIGGWIVYDDQGGIWAYDPNDPHRPVVHVNSPGGTPIAWSPDGTKLLLLVGRPAQSLYVLNADGTETRLAHVGANTLLTGGAFSPDGSEVVYAVGPFALHTRSAIDVVPASGGPPRRILSSTHRFFYAPGQWTHTLLLSPVFSPDGTQIAYFDGMGDHDNTLRVMNSDGSGSHLLLKDMGKLSPGPTNLAWSPDGRRLIFAAGYGEYSTYGVRADGSGFRLLARCGHPFLSPDGARISCTHGPDGAVVLTRADGTFIRTLAIPSNGPWNPAARS